ncbi:hypothetical protein J437_LFUL000422 [Ladona fulva]|uniref:3'-5' exonuclease domain-containing protein n=1 Tax=Ladona fulva TaxID=123851 RepID=A0A8K0K7L8_LADFU|nr:hypothetical protein J437_LFUL000422 [Ladona fulva]
METSTGCTSVSVSEDFPEEDDCEDQISSSFLKKQEECEEEDNKAKGKHVEKVKEDVRKEELEFHHLHLSDDKIILVDSIDSLLELMSNGLQGVEVIGLDCEWKPSFYSQTSKVALLQMAMWKRIYLIDVLSLNDIPSYIWDDFNKIVFENENILKLGFDISADKSMLVETVPHLRGFGTVSFLDLSSVWKTLINKFGFMFPNGDITLQGGHSLTQLVTLCFGKSLDKSDQFSNWENRPLRKSQQLYAGKII